MGIEKEIKIQFLIRYLSEKEILTSSDIIGMTIDSE